MLTPEVRPGLHHEQSDTPGGPGDGGVDDGFHDDGQGDDHDHGWASAAGRIALIGGALGVALGFGLAHVLGFGGPDSSSAPKVTAASPTTRKATSKATESAATRTTSTTPTPTTTPTTTPTPTAVMRTLPVRVCNAGTVSGLASTGAARARTAGWSSTYSNCRGLAAANTVFYPAGEQDQGQQLARDLGISTVVPASSAMNASRLTVAVVTR